MLNRFALVAALLLPLVAAPAASSAAGIGGLMIFAHDGTFLGAVPCSDVGNRYARHGSKFSSQSIWNRYSTYGSDYSSLSPFNRYTSTPPVLVDGDGDAVGHLSANPYVSGAISPVELEAYLMETCDSTESYRD